MFDKRKTNLRLTEYRNDEIDFEIKKDITEMSSSDLIDTFVDVMQFQGYHPVAIWRSLKDKSEEMVELFESIENSKEEWNEEV